MKFDHPHLYAGLGGTTDGSVNSTSCVLLFMMCQYGGLAFKRTLLRKAPAGWLRFCLEFLTGNFFGLFPFFTYYSLSYEEKVSIGSDLGAQKINADRSVKFGPNGFSLFVTNRAHEAFLPLTNLRHNIK
jgi:hypothetical protein